MIRAPAFRAASIKAALREVAAAAQAAEASTDTAAARLHLEAARDAILTALHALNEAEADVRFARRQETWKAA
jgi:hypothetical protein